MRLNVYLQKAGIGSRREAERFVADGRVTVNGALALATTPVNDGDVVKVDNKIVAPDTRSQPRLFMLNKPLDYLCTTYDSQGRKTVYDLDCFLPPKWPTSMPRIMNVGRLDVNSEGLLLFSTDGPLAQALMNPKTGLERVYRIRVHGRLNAAQIQQLADGIEIDGVYYRGAQLTEEKKPEGQNTWYRIVLTEGKNREVRKLMEYFGCVVNRLIRVQYGPFTLGTLERGRVQEIPAADVAHLIDNLKQHGHY